MLVYGITNEVKDDDESNLSIEQQLAPWITTKNFFARDPG